MQCTNTDVSFITLRSAVVFDLTYYQLQDRINLCPSAMQKLL